MADVTASQARWIDAIHQRLLDELPYARAFFGKNRAESDNRIVADAVRDFLTEHPERIDAFVGTTIIEESYFILIDRNAKKTTNVEHEPDS